MSDKRDCCFTEGNNWFRFRAGGIIVEDKNVLFVTDDICDYFYTVGGGVHLGEKSEDCVEREVFEETGIHYEADHLAAVIENFFDGDGGSIDKLNCHCIEFYYLMKSQGIKQIDTKSLSHGKNQSGNNERLEWIPIDKIKEYNIKPSFLKERINEIIESKNILHIITDVDKKN